MQILQIDAQPNYQLGFYLILLYGIAVLALCLSALNWWSILCLSGLIGWDCYIQWQKHITRNNAKSVVSLTYRANQVQIIFRDGTEYFGELATKPWYIANSWLLPLKLEGYGRCVFWIPCSVLTAVGYRNLSRWLFCK